MASQISPKYSRNIFDCLQVPTQYNKTSKINELKVMCKQRSKISTSKTIFINIHKIVIMTFNYDNIDFKTTTGKHMKSSHIL